MESKRINSNYFGSAVRFKSFLSGLAAASILSAASSASAAFSATDNGTVVTVDSGAGLVYTCKKDGISLNSIKWNGVELNGANNSTIASGVGGTVTLTKPNSTTALITVASSDGTIKHYFATRANENAIYMATYTTAEPGVGELRWITRMNGNVLTGVPAPSNNTGNTGAIESADINGHADGTTTSKYYGNQQAKDLSIRGVTGKNVGVFMVYGSRETSSGGPFYRDIQNQSGGDTEVYNYMNSGHNQTENPRMGLHGPYALLFTTGATPAIPDTSWMSTLGLAGWVDSATRGKVIGNGIAGMDSAYTYTVGFANTTAQYWTTATAGSGTFRCYGMIPGTYDMTIYKGELAVWTGSATVPTGGSQTFHTITITGDPSTTATLWRIGNWDGTPLEFLNAGNIANMHPSDVRMHPWVPTTFTVGSSATGSFPAVQFRGANSPTTIKFTLTAAQAAAAHTLVIGITDAYASGRPDPTINGHTLTGPGASGQPSSRSFTIGSYRGNNTTYTWSIPAADFVTGVNTLTITPISGSGDLGAWLSASFSYDCVELDN
jgi:rhamnogalacturonan endolyase